MSKAEEYFSKNISSSLSLLSDEEEVIREFARLKSQEDNLELVEALKESNLQIKYLHSKFKETGSGNTIVSRNESLIAKHSK